MLWEKFWLFQKTSPTALENYSWSRCRNVVNSDKIFTLNMCILDGLSQNVSFQKMNYFSKTCGANFANLQHLFALKLEIHQTITFWDWVELTLCLPLSPKSYNLWSFKTPMHKHLHHQPFPWSLLFSLMQGPLFLCIPLESILKKKKNVLITFQSFLSLF